MILRSSSQNHQSTVADNSWVRQWWVLLIFVWGGLGVIYGILCALDHIGFSILKNSHWIGLFIFLGLAILLSIASLLKQKVLIIRWNSSGSSDGLDNCVAYLKNMYASNNFHHVIQMGHVICRRLFLEGKLRSRYEVGCIMEQSAEKIGDDKERCIALIDYIGWSLVLKKPQTDISKKEALQKIQHGIELAQNNGYHYWHAKGVRHLAAIDYINEDYGPAIEKLNDASEVASQIKNNEEKEDMQSSIYYDIALNYYNNKDFPTALDWNKISRDFRLNNGEKAKLCGNYSLEGKIYEAQGKLEKAKDLFNKGLMMASEVGRVDEIIRCNIGLARVFAENGKIGDARWHLDIAKKLQREKIDFSLYGKEKEPDL